MSSKALIHIGASNLQVPTIFWAKEAGLDVLICDMTPDPAGKDLGVEFAQIGGSDVDGLTSQALEWAKRYEIVGCYCNGDFGLKAVAEINRVLELKTAPNLQAVIGSLDKELAMKKMQKAGLPVAVFKVSSDSSEWSGNFPAIVKPANSSGSRGVRVVETQRDLDAAVIEAKEFSDTVLIEEYLRGHHIDVSGFFAEGNFFPGGQLDRYFSELPFRFPIWGAQPRQDQSCSEADIYALLEKAARLMGIDVGPVKGDFILTSDGPKIIEISPRFHGETSTAFVCPLSYDTGPIEAWFRYLAEGSLPKEGFLSKASRVAGWRGLFPKQAGVLEEISGVEEASQIEGVDRVYIHRQPGFKVKGVSDNLALLGFIWASAPTHEELEERLKKADRLIHFRMG